MPSVSGLGDARLKLSLTLNATKHTYEDKLSNIPRIVIRKDNKYGGPLKPGRVELIGDYVLPGMFVETGNYTIRAELLLPDGRVLFCIEASLYLEGDG